MKTFKTLTVLAVLLVAFALTACGSKPPRVSKSEIETNRQEVAEIEGRVNTLQNQKSQMEAELNAKNAKIDALQQWADEVGGN